MTAEFSKKIKDLRESLGLTQAEFGARLGVRQPSVFAWEKGDAKPQPMMMIAIANLSAQKAERDWWLDQAGKTKEMLDQTVQRYMEIASAADAVRVPFISGKIAAGSPRAVDEKDVEKRLCIPAEWIAPSQRVFAVRVTGDSMSPIIEEGYIILVDTAQRDPKKLLRQMVVARESDGITVKWLRKDGPLYLLVPQNTSVRHPVRVLSPDEESPIVGRVVKWIGEPPKR